MRPNSAGSPAAGTASFRRRACVAHGEILRFFGIRKNDLHQNQDLEHCPFRVNRKEFATVIPAKAETSGRLHQITAFAGMTPDGRAIRSVRTMR
jgi:hypothetical protein